MRPLSILEVFPVKRSNNPPVVESLPREEVEREFVNSETQKSLPYKSARPKNISGWSGKFITYANRALKGQQPKRGEKRKLADKFLKNYPKCTASRATLERAWQRAQVGAQSAR